MSLTNTLMTRAIMKQLSVIQVAPILVEDPPIMPRTVSSWPESFDLLPVDEYGTWWARSIATICHNKLDAAKRRQRRLSESTYRIVKGLAFVAWTRHLESIGVADAETVKAIGSIERWMHVRHILGGTHRQHHGAFDKIGIVLPDQFVAAREVLENAIANIRCGAIDIMKP